MAITELSGRVDAHQLQPDPGAYARPHPADQVQGRARRQVASMRVDLSHVGRDGFAPLRAVRQEARRQPPHHADAATLDGHEGGRAEDHQQDHGDGRPQRRRGRAAAAHMQGEDHRAQERVDHLGEHLCGEVHYRGAQHHRLRHALRHHSLRAKHQAADLAEGEHVGGPLAHHPTPDEAGRSGKRLARRAREPGQAQHAQHDEPIADEDRKAAPADGGHRRQHRPPPHPGDQPRQKRQPDQRRQHRARAQVPRLGRRAF